MKFAESLPVAAAAKTAVAFTCQEDVTITNQSNQKAGYEFEETKYVLDMCPKLAEAKGQEPADLP